MVSTILPETLAFRSADTPHKVAFSFLADGETLTDSITYRALAEQSRALARHLLTLARPQDRVLLIHQPGIEYVVAVMGCMQAGLIAVPAYPPRPQRADPRLAAILADCAPTLTLTDERTFRRLDGRTESAALPGLMHWRSDQTAADLADDAIAVPSPDDVAFLQYTSGSTAEPKGVVLTHRNLAANLAAIEVQFGLHEDVVGLSWLPPYHDMGLIGFIFETIHLGCHLVLMPPTAFVQRPLRWLQAIERFQVCTTGAPNFGYEHCLRKIPATERAALNLRSWKRAFNGAEPVRAATLRSFAAGFAVAGFDPNALTPCYGLAESTLLVSGTAASDGAVIRRFDEAALALHDARLMRDGEPAAGRELVSSGRVAPHAQVLIAAVDGTEVQPEGSIGEICVTGASVSRGYWNTTATDATPWLQHHGATYLRTGDLGFLFQGELFVTGRLKDLIILRGRNHYPQDIEETVGAAHPALQPGAAAAFAITGEREERLVLVVEVTRTFRAEQHLDVVAAIRDAVAAEHALQAHDVVLLRPGQLPRTSSGKVRRRTCRTMWLKRGLSLAVDPAAPTDAASTTTPRETDDGGEAPSRSAATADRLIAWLREYGATRINSRLIDERRTIPPYVVLDFGNQGLMGLQVAREFGGLELTHGDALRVMEQVAGIDLTLASFLGVHQALGTRPIKHFASPALQRALLPAIAGGRELAAFALTEPGAGSNPLALQSKAVPQPDGSWRLYGQKEWIGLGSWAGVITVFAQMLDAEQRPMGITAFVVRQGTPGLRQGPEVLTMGVRGMVQNRIFLDGVRVTAAEMLGQAGDGMRVAQDAMMFGRLGLGVMSLAAMRRAAQLMVRYASRRTISTGRLLDNPVTLTRLNTLTSAVFATESLVYQMARWLDADVSVPAELFMAVKITAPELLGRAVDDLVQLLGGRGYVEPNLVPQLLRDARLIRIFEGPTETLTMALGAHATRDPAALLSFVRSQWPSADLAARLEALIQRSKPAGRTPSAWTVYQLGEFTAYALLLAATRSQPSSCEREHAVRWLERTLTEQEAAITSDAFAVMAPADATELVDRIAHYAQSIGDGVQTLAGEDDVPDALLADGPAPLTRSSVPSASTAPTLAPTLATAPAPVADAPHDTVRAALCEYLATLLEITPAEIEGTKPLVHYGLDSIRLVELQFHVEQAHAYVVSAEAFFSLLTLDDLARMITAARTGHPGSATGGSMSATDHGVAARPRTDAVVARPLATERPRTAAMAAESSSRMDFSLFFFSDSAAHSRGNPYQLVLEAARFADDAGFKAVWVPERHFHPFGGLYPNPAVVASALSMVTRNLRLRAGSVVLPLHHPARVAEEWAVVDNLSGGRVDLAFTPGWSANDFVLAQDNYTNRLETMYESLRTFETLWRGDAGRFRNGLGEQVELCVYPRPQGSPRAIWLTCTRGRERFEKAGELGANVLTALLMQTTDELTENIAAYRASRARHGFDPDGGVVTLMLHTYLGDDLPTVRDVVRAPLHEYLLSSVTLWQLTEQSLDQLAPADHARLLDLALERYLRTSSLIGTVESTLETVRAVQRIGVNEIACLIDFGVDDARTLRGLRHVVELRERLQQPHQPFAADSAEDEEAVLTFF